MDSVFNVPVSENCIDEFFAIRLHQVLKSFSISLSTEELSQKKEKLFPFKSVTAMKWHTNSIGRLAPRVQMLKWEHWNPKEENRPELFRFRFLLSSSMPNKGHRRKQFQNRKSRTKLCSSHEIKNINQWINSELGKQSDFIISIYHLKCSQQTKTRQIVKYFVF